MLSFERSPDTDAAIATLRTINGLTPYASLAKQSGLTVARFKAVLPSARRVLFRENGTIFGVEIGIGIRRLGDSDKVKDSENTRRRSSRMLRRGGKKLETIEQFELLSKAEQLIATTNRTIFRMLAQQLSGKSAMEEPRPTTKANPGATVAALTRRQT